MSDITSLQAVRAVLNVVRYGMLAACLVLLTGLGSAPLMAQDDYEDVLGGFDDGGFDDGGGEDEPEQSQAGANNAGQVEDGAGEFLGSILVSSTYNYKSHEVIVDGTETDYQGVSKLRTQFNLQYDSAADKGWKYRVSGYAFYDWAYSTLHSDRDYTDDVIDEYELEVELKEFWIQGQLERGDVDLKIGRQIVNWGRSDTLRVLDVLNPLDNREVGLADIENLRLPVFMLKRDYYFDVWNFSMIVIPETRFSKNPPLGSDFNTVSFSLDGETIIDIPEKEPADIKGTSWAMGLTGIFSGWDISFHLARIWNDRPHLEPLVVPDFDPSNINIAAMSAYRAEFRHSRVNFFGIGGNYSSGSWLFKGEAALLSGLDYTVGVGIDLGTLGIEPFDLPTDTIQRKRMDVLVGIEYYGFANTVLTLETLNRRVDGYKPEIGAFYIEENMQESTVRYDGNFLNERLRITALIALFSGKDKDASILRLEAAYELLDGLKLTTGILTYQDGDLPPFDAMDDNDRIFFDLKKSF